MCVNWVLHGGSGSCSVASLILFCCLSRGGILCVLGGLWKQTHSGGQNRGSLRDCAQPQHWQQVQGSPPEAPRSPFPQGCRFPCQGNTRVYFKVAERQAQNVTTTQDLGNIRALPIARDNVPRILTKRGQITFFFFFFWVFRLAELCRRACREEGNISS